MTSRTRSQALKLLAPRSRLRSRYGQHRPVYPRSNKSLTEPRPDEVRRRHTCRCAQAGWRRQSWEVSIVLPCGGAYDARFSAACWVVAQTRGLFNRVAVAERWDRTRQGLKPSLASGPSPLLGSARGGHSIVATSNKAGAPNCSQETPRPAQQATCLRGNLYINRAPCLGVPSTSVRSDARLRHSHRGNIHRCVTLDCRGGAVGLRSPSGGVGP